MLATVLQGLVPGVPYHAEVAAATGAGVGARSAPVPIHIGECPRTVQDPWVGATGVLLVVGAVVGSSEPAGSPSACSTSCGAGSRASRPGWCG